MSEFIVYKCNKVDISWFGGEPTLFKDETLSFMRELRRRLGPDVNLIGGMTTNAYLLTPDEFLDCYGVGISDYQIQTFGVVCYASKPNSFVVDPYGKIRKCTVALKDEKNIVGEILDESNYYINNYILARWTKVKLKDAECDDCCIYPACMQRGCADAMIGGQKGCVYNKSAVFNFLSKLADIAYRQLADNKTDISADR
jgi:radical SAM protein with 4Fe4S-binding SPASM domain